MRYACNALAAFRRSSANANCAKDHSKRFDREACAIFALKPLERLIYASDEIELQYRVL
jgi:hypothetical protein